MYLSCNDNFVQANHNISIIDSSRIETFVFANNGTHTKAKIYLPPSYSTNKNLPTIFLIDFTEQHVKLATDEFEKVINGVKQIAGFEALVVSLEGIPDIDAQPDSFQDHFDIYKNMATYVTGTYTNNRSRTFIGKGSEGGLVLMALFVEESKNTMFDNFIVSDPSPKYAQAIINLIEKGEIPENKANKKLHLSFSKTNNRDLCNDLIKHINDGQFPWLQFESKEFATSDHETTYPIAFAEGLQYVFKN
jgi:predicted alpha/beta superfamily hydrolase